MPEKRAPAARQEKNMKNAMNLMVVDDNSRARRALTAYLSAQAGIKVTAEASNGLEAIKMIKRNTPDMVLMDVRMPVMDGLETTRIIKRNWPQIKILVLTMYSDYQSEVISAGADGFLIKGCPVDEMMGLIHRFLQMG
jgi:DNA-binding NarL/FixJ family response regulator